MVQFCAPNDTLVRLSISSLTAILDASSLRASALACNLQITPCCIKA